MEIEKAIKVKSFKDNRHKASVNLIYTFNWLQEKQRAIFGDYDLQPQHYNLLRIIKGHHPKAITPGEIKKVMLDKGRDITRLVDKLVKLGYVDRRLQEFNRRCVDISIRPEGIEVCELLSAKVDHLMNTEIKLSEVEAETLSELLDKLRG